MKPSQISHQIKTSFTLTASHYERINAFLSKHLQISRNQVRKRLDSGNVFINNQPVWIAKFQVQPGDRVDIIKPEQAQQKLSAASVLFDGVHFLMVNKPTGLAVESKTGIFPVLQKLNRIGYEDLSLVHRLDKETSGLLIVAQHASFRRHMRTHWSAVQKSYLAICFGRLPKQRGTINLPIKYSDQDQYVAEDRWQRSRTAVTQYKVLAYSQKENLSLIECTPKTGRIHQIRIHLASVGHPVIGDKRYARQAIGHPWYKRVSRHMLHAQHITFVFDNQSYRFKAPIPTDFLSVYNLLTKQ